MGVWECTIFSDHFNSSLEMDFVSNACSLIRSLLIVRTSHDTLLLSSAVNSMANKLVLLAMIVESTMATNADTRNPPSFLRFARLFGVNFRAFDNITQGWNKIKWEDLESYKKVKVRMRTHSAK